MPRTCASGHGRSRLAGGLVAPYDWLRQVPAVAALRRIWVQQFCGTPDHWQWRTPREGKPRAAQQIRSPFEVEARYAEQRGHGWLGDKVQLSETCATDAPRLITQVTTTPVTTPDVIALPAARARLQTPGYQQTYAACAGIEGTISQAVRRSDLRQARYVGQAKTQLQRLLTATALNLVRVLNWLLGVPTARPRRSRFRQLPAPLPVRD